MACARKMWEEAGCTTRNEFIHGWIEWGRTNQLTLDQLKHDFYL